MSSLAIWTRMMPGSVFHKNDVQVHASRVISAHISFKIKHVQFSFSIRKKKPCNSILLKSRRRIQVAKLQSAPAFTRIEYALSFLHNSVKRLLTPNSLEASCCIRCAFSSCIRNDEHKCCLIHAQGPSPDLATQALCT